MNDQGFQPAVMDKIKNLDASLSHERERHKITCEMLATVTSSNKELQNNYSLLNHELVIAKDEIVRLRALQSEKATASASFLDAIMSEEDRKNFNKGELMHLLMLSELIKEAQLIRQAIQEAMMNTVKASITYEDCISYFVIDDDYEWIDHGAPSSSARLVSHVFKVTDENLRKDVQTARDKCHQDTK